MATRQPRSSHLTGLLVVDKPLGWSSMDVVRRVRRAADQCKTGHAGTLDPLATGVVVCCLGRATRCVETIMGLTKVYEAEIDLSAFTVTDDLESQPEPVPMPGPPPLEDRVRAALSSLVGVIDQGPPAFSALRVGGRRAYDLARQGIQATMPTRRVRVDAIDLRQYDWPKVSVRIVCGRGTYVRSIARDLGTALQTGGHLTALKRTAVGPYDLAVAVTAERLGHPITQADLHPMPERR